MEKCTRMRRIKKNMYPKYIFGVKSDRVDRISHGILSRQNKIK